MVVVGRGNRWKGRPSDRPVSHYTTRLWVLEEVGVLDGHKGPWISEGPRSFTVPRRSYLNSDDFLLRSKVCLNFLYVF